MRFAWAVVTVACALTLGACGGDDPEEQIERRRAAQEGKAKQAFIEKADRACTEYRAASDRAERAGGGIKEVVAVRVAAAKLVDRLRALTPPSPDRKIVEQYLASLEGLVRTVLPEVEQAARRKDRAGVQRALAKLRRRGEQSRALAQRYGFRVCGSSRG